jgi:hypothetical protein
MNEIKTQSYEGDLCPQRRDGNTIFTNRMISPSMHKWTGTEVKNIITELYEEGYLGECMSRG